MSAIRGLILYRLYRKIGRCKGQTSARRRCPLFGVSVIRGSTVVSFSLIFNFSSFKTGEMISLMYMYMYVHALTLYAICMYIHVHVVIHYWPCNS